LHPPQFSYSEANAVSGNFQGGYVNPVYDVGPHAALWNGTPESYVDLHPAGFTHSMVRAMDGNVQVGQGRGVATGNNTHALLWTGTVGSVVDLNPSGITESYMRGISGDLQVGFGRGPRTANRLHAFVWNGNADSAVDLHQFLDGLPISFRASEAWDVNHRGAIVGWAQDNNFNGYAILWTPVVPEPGPCTLLACLVAAAPMHRQLRRRTRANPFLSLAV
jgi:hypothetical protein